MQARRPVLLAFALLAMALYAPITRWHERAALDARMQKLDWTIFANRAGEVAPVADPALLVRVAELDGLLASWQTIGGCGAGAGAASSAGLKWIGRNVTGGLFNVQEQVSYTNLGTSPYDEHNLFVNTFINADLAQKWNVGLILPLVYKYLADPLHLAPDAINYSNGGLGDISLLVTRRLGATNATSLTGIVGLPTGTWDATYPSGRALNQNAQLGYGKVTGAVVLDRTLDEIWGLVVLGGVAAYRGGHNELDNYRAPTASVYGYSGYFLGPFVPSAGLVLSAFKGHDVDQQSEQFTPLASVSGQASLEWSTDWIALLLAASISYKYDGIHQDDSGLPRSPWGFMPWTIALGVSLAPF